MQNLSLFKQPSGFRGRSAIVCQLWWILQAVLFGMSPQFMYGWRNFLLRLFGARIGNGVKIRPTARVTFPWKLTIGDQSWVGDEVALYSLGEIIIGHNVVISQRSYICTGSHDATRMDFPIYSKTVRIEDGAWLATDVFVHPGVTIKMNAVVAARSTVLNDLEGGYIYAGAPARKIKPRTFSPSGIGV